MRKHAVALLGLIFSLVLIAAGVFILSRGKSGINWKSNWKHELSIKNGVFENDSSTGNFIVDRSGNYALNIGWNLQGKKNADPGFMTGCKITNDAGEVIYSVGAHAADVRTTLELDKGNYNLLFAYFVEEGTAVKDGTYTMEYHLNVTEQRILGTVGIAAVLAILLGSSILLIALIAVFGGRKKGEARYDERQKIEQGCGYRYAFYSILITIGVSLMLDTTGIATGGMTALFYTASICIGLLVYATYGYWHDCYVALNEKRGFTVTLLFLIGVLNLIIGISGLLSEGILNGAGKMNTPVINLLVGATCALLAIIGLVRFAIEKKSDGRDED